MNWIKKIARPLILVVLPAVIIACSVSYKFNGSSINYDKVKTISIADFPIKSEYVYAPLATKFNEDLKDIFIRQTRLQLLKPNQNADLQIDGEITGFFKGLNNGRLYLFFRLNLCYAEARTAQTRLDETRQTDLFHNIFVGNRLSLTQ